MKANSVCHTHADDVDSITDEIRSNPRLEPRLQKNLQISVKHRTNKHPSSSVSTLLPFGTAGVFTAKVPQEELSKK